MKKKIVALCLCIALAVVAIGGATLAYFTDKTDTVTNTFTVGKVDIELWEHAYDATTNTLSQTKKMDGTVGKLGNSYHIVPGVDLPKDPTVVVKGGSDACWLFVKVTAAGWPANQTFYTLKTTDADGWTQGDGTNIPDDVYYRAVPATTTDTTFGLLTGDKVVIPTTVTAADVASMTNVTLTFTAYAIQQTGFENNAVAAWTEVSKTANP